MKFHSLGECSAKTRSGGQCQRAGNPKNGRCHLHGGASTGPKTAEGRARIAAAQFKHGRRSKKAMYAELKAIEAICIESGLLRKDWESAFRFF